MIATLLLAIAATSPPTPPRSGEGSKGAEVFATSAGVRPLAPPSRFGKGVGGLGNVFVSPAEIYEIVAGDPPVSWYFTVEAAAGPLPKLEAELLQGWKPSADGSDPLDRLVPDGRLLRVEIAAPCPYSGPLTAAIFRTLDANADGKLTPDEFKDAAARLLAKVDVDGDGCLAPLEIVPDLIHAKPASAKPTPVKVVHADPRRVFTQFPPEPTRIRFDTPTGSAVAGRDVRIHLTPLRAEPGSAPEVPRALQKPGREKEKERFEKVAAAVVTVTVRPHARGWFDRLDADGDGRLSLRELRNTQRELFDLDARHRGFVVMPDLTNGTAASLTFAPGVRTPPPVRLNPPPRPARGPEWFAALDRNADGDLSRAEFVGTDAEFKRYDADNDGLIDVAEAEAGDRTFTKGAKP